MSPPQPDNPYGASKNTANKALVWHSGRLLALWEGGKPHEIKLPRFGVLPRHGDNSSIRWFEAPPSYVFHTLNAYEHGEEVILIACRMNGTTVFNASGNGGGHDSDIPQLHRWCFHLSSGAVVEERLDDIPSEFPRVNEQLLGRPTRYGYTAQIAPSPIPLFNGFIKYDLFTGGSQTHEFGRGRYGGEGVFVPRPGATAEDDGWLLTFVYDELEQRSELVVVMAQDITAEPVARIIIPNRVPYGFHGTWISYNRCLN